MTLRRKVTSDFINRGADVVSDKSPKVLKSVDICLRMPYNMMKRIDGIRKEGVSRNAWIRDAISDRLEKLEG
jgi:hypothetical protein